jgi:hypothetical protein
MYYYQQPGFPFSFEKTAVQGGANAMKVFGLILMAGILGFLHYLMLKWSGFASLLLIPIYGGAIYYVNRVLVYKKITWGEVDRANTYS